jgi:AcrR family transcriptional regulator
VETAVVEATVAEITEKGLSSWTMEAIANRAGVGKATLYRRWPNKEELFYFLASKLADTFEPIDTGDLRKDLLSAFEPLLDQVNEGPVAALMPTFIAEAARDPRMREVVSRLVADRRAGATLALERAKARGQLRPRVDVDIVVDSIAGAITYRGQLLGEPVTVRFIRKVVDQVLEGVLEVSP